MDNKRLILVMFLSMALMTLWIIGFPWVAERMGWDLAPTPSPQQTDATTRPGGPTTGPASVPAGGLVVLSPAQPRTITLGSAQPSDTYALGLTLSNVGAGVNEVVLNAYQLTVDGADRYRFGQPFPLAPDATRSLATRSVTINGQTIDLSGVPWVVDEQSSGPDQVTFFVDVGRAGGPPIARVTKVIKLYPRVENEQDLRGGYELLVRQEVTNASGAPLTVRTTLNGPTTPPRELEYGIDRMIIAGYQGRNGTLTHTGHQVEVFTDDDQSRELIAEGETPLLWAGQSSIYFNAIVRPVETGLSESGSEARTTTFIDDVVAEALNPDDEDAANRQVVLRFVSREQTVTPGATLQQPFRVYLGPKARDLLKNAYYASAATRYDETLVSPFGCTWCVFQPVVNVLVWLLTGFYFVLKDWGLAIIALVVVVRLLLHPITKRSQRSMMRMSKLGPEMEKLKKKYGDDKEAMSKAMQEFYREHGLAALPLGCLPMLLQTPIWIALYSMLQAEFRLRHEPFLYGLTWINDLAKPDHLIEFGRSITLPILPPISGLNLLPFLLGGMFWVQMKVQPQPAAMTPEQQTQQTIMKWMMVLMFPLFLYSAPAGLNIYILTSTLIGIWESKRIRAQLKAEEDAKAAEQPTLVQDKAPRSARRRDGKNRDDDKPDPPTTGWRAKLAQFQTNLQKHVEQAQKDAAKRAGERKK